MFVFRLYQLLSFLAWPLLRLLLIHRIKKGKESPERYKEKLGVSPLARPQNGQKLIWLHAASVGESLSVLALIERLLAHDHNTHILVTTGTLTSAELMQKRLPERAFHQFAPLDHPVWVRRFLRHWRPDLVLWVESELWPNTLHAVHRRNIPLLLINGRMSPDSFKKWQKLRGLVRFILSKFNRIMAQRAEDAFHFENLGAQDVQVTDNLKFSAPPLPYDHQDLKMLEPAFSQRPAWMMVSTHPGEEEIALETHKALALKTPNLLTVIVPRHPTRRQEIEHLLAQSTLPYSFRSKDKTISPDTGIYVADTLGEMGLFYRLGGLVVIGGSFVNVGGHNPIEAAQLGCTIISGPVIFNFTDTFADLEKAEGALIVQSGEKLPEIIDHMFHHPEEAAKIAANALDVSVQKNHVIEVVLENIAPFLNNGVVNPQNADQK